MADDQIIQITRAIASPILIALTVAIAARQLDRVRRHRKYRSESPDILVRDVVFFWGLALLLVASAVAGAFGIVLAQVPLWVVFSSCVGVGLLAMIAFYEYAVIGRRNG